jgi:hypothetical protein
MKITHFLIDLLLQVKNLNGYVSMMDVLILVFILMNYLKGLY